MKKRTGDPWMPTDEYGRGLRGIGVNLLVSDIDAQVEFIEEVLELERVYSDPDFAVFRHDGHDLLLHADHTYEQNPLREIAISADPRGAGAELRLYGLDPDACAKRAAARGECVLVPPTDRGHGLRECFIIGPDGYVWVPGHTI